MLDLLRALFLGDSNVLVLRSYGWRRRKSFQSGEPVVQWQDPASRHWYSERTALRLVRIQVFDELGLK